jgi:hypothetical protein
LRIGIRDRDEGLGIGIRDRDKGSAIRDKR